MLGIPAALSAGVHAGQHRLVLLGPTERPVLIEDYAVVVVSECGNKLDQHDAKVAGMCKFLLATLYALVDPLPIVRFELC